MGINIGKQGDLPFEGSKGSGDENIFQGGPCWANKHIASGFGSRDVDIVRCPSRVVF